MKRDRSYWGSISFGEDKLPLIYSDANNPIGFASFDDYREFVMTLVGAFNAHPDCPYKITIKAKEDQDGQDS